MSTVGNDPPVSYTSRHFHQQGYYTGFQTYTAFLPTLVSNGFRQSANVNIAIMSGEQTYTFTATHGSCDADSWTVAGSGNSIDPPSLCD